ncbi:MAG: dihydropyrimidinase [Deltaproteobacteria bacterium RBG_16_49_23]|nr:MAG: dihydropyrimidinase [Deltaproteobacteria bacterium RBG_16_49_23]
MEKKYDILFQKGLVVSGSGIRKADVAVKGEKIARVEPGLKKEEAGRIIDASGKYVMPGVIDVHVHPVYEDDMGGLSLTAAHGGVTTLIHFAYAKPGMKLIDTIKQYQEEGSKKSCLDFGIHGTLFDPASQIEEIPRAFDLGVSSFKMFMAYAKLKWMTDDYHLAAAMDLIAECGGMAMVHAENGLVTDYLEDRSLKRGEDQRRVFLMTRPDRLEAEAIFRAITIAAVTRCPLYIVHLSTAKGVLPLQQAKAEGQAVYVETCPQYLTMTDTKLQRLGPLAKIGPPLRTEKDRVALWKAIQEGIVDTVASDHAPKAKKLGDPFFESPFGSPQTETMFTVTYDEGVNKGKIKPERCVQLFSENPARIFGLYPKKGTIRQGSDADLFIFDPEKFHMLQQQTQHSGAHYTLYEGRRCKGKPVLVMQRGKILVENGETRARPGDGKFQPTKIIKGKL